MPATTVVKLGVLFSIYITLNFTIHRVDEGFVGVYYRGGALLSEVAKPGYNLMIPYITTYHPVQVTHQTDVIRNGGCVTNGGVIIYFEKIEIDNILNPKAVYDIIKNYTLDYDRTLIFHKINHILKDFCSKRTLREIYLDTFDTIGDELRKTLQEDLDEVAPGLEIKSIKVSKPKIPEEIRKGYELMEIEKTKLLVAVERQKVVEMEEETERKRAVIIAEKEAEVSRIRLEQKMREEKLLREISFIDDEIHTGRVKARADADFYKTKQEAEGNNLLLTKEYLELKKYEALATINKIYIGDTLLKMILSNTFAGKQFDNSTFQETMRDREEMEF